MQTQHLVEKAIGGDYAARILEMADSIENVSNYLGRDLNLYAGAGCGNSSHSASSTGNCNCNVGRSGLERKL